MVNDDGNGAIDHYLGGNVVLQVGQHFDTQSCPLLYAARESGAFNISSNYGQLTLLSTYLHGSIHPGRTPVGNVMYRTTWSMGQVYVCVL